MQIEPGHHQVRAPMAALTAPTTSCYDFRALTFSGSDCARCSNHLQRPLRRRPLSPHPDSAAPFRARAVISAGSPPRSRRDPWNDLAMRVRRGAASAPTTRAFPPTVAAGRGGDVAVDTMSHGESQVSSSPATTACRQDVRWLCATPAGLWLRASGEGDQGGRDRVATITDSAEKTARLAHDHGASSSTARAARCPDAGAPAVRPSLEASAPTSTSPCSR
jgi:hypothetical protein